MEDKGEYKSHEEETKWQAFRKMLWNSDTKECLGRTGLSWCKYFAFIIVLYINEIVCIVTKIDRL